MAGKSSKGKSNGKSERVDQQTRQLRWARIAFGIFAVILVLSMLLSLVSKF